MRTAEIRRRYLDYFAERDHTVVPSASLISADPSILFTIAGMVPFIPYIVGTEQAPYSRAVSVQKCIRTNDIEEVGRTTRHGTFFQMNGNFSFGDYFKEGAVEFAWELMTSSQDDGGFGLDPDLLWVTVWEEDAETARVLREVIDFPAERVVPLSRADSFWDTGQPGPAGPTAEWHLDRGADRGPDGGPAVDTAGDRYVEFWNLVFDEFLRGPGPGKDYPLLGELPMKSIDTGMGLERVAAILQGKDNIYEIDEVFGVIARAEELSGRRYGASREDDVRMRVVADHVRSAMMLVSDGVKPSNEGRGYVLRRLLRRSVRAMRLLGVTDPALPELLPVSKDVMKASYPELEADFGRISTIVYDEEDAFRRTLTSGTTILDTAVRRLKESGGSQLGGEQAFALHDTYGFPIDLTLEMAAEQGVSVDEEAFRRLMGEQRARARADALAKRSGHADTSVYRDIAGSLPAPVSFLGYTDAEARVAVVGLLVDGVPAPAAQAPAEVEVVLDRTPFYAEAGGQLADQGQIVLDDGAVVEVDDVQAPIKGLSVHRGRLVEGVLGLGSSGVASIDTARRRAIARAHTATHMVHKAIREHVGESATQAGSENAPSRFRFDFRSGSALPSAALAEINARVNTLLADDLDVTDEVMALDDARAAGAMALFGEKYGDRVRVVSIGGDWSKELCAGTHVASTGHLGLVTLLGESSIGSGVRRVDALVGDGAFGYQAKEHALVGQLTQLVGARGEELPERVSSLMTRLKEAEREIQSLRQGRLLAAAASLAASAALVSGARVVTHDAGEVASVDDVRALVVDLRDRLGEAQAAVVVVGGVAKGRAVVVAATNPAARESGVRAGELVRVAAGALGGGGGGRDDLAQGGGSDPDQIPAALEQVVAAVGRTLDERG
ncbi:alanyl-tRNA synthetase [Beutenbergia cavernae DSM 12333]|uniref:Alanine--tRNA ligase n=1 Tax=Beutenbergia cavernae (strain ATCC BAA-8 / DSM 12333 / CCUG 43141 / JCM 11478 / NBRC 16432 / NCIMB 13614 / HKI 0122) TaxID=471853 RepID=C5C5S8_BEUC1|nr:alanine--tRNA ligase [Beutenbergia cavernae]ACQ80269.1 alanyl-tRNA synthetase [Beutenbergia cavernae DSM 12333]